MDEEFIWAFNLTGYNQMEIVNPYIRDPLTADKMSHAPFWGEKLITPAFYSDEKLERFYRQWGLRFGLEKLKMKHAQMDNQPGDKRLMRQVMKEEIEEYLQYAHEKDNEDFLKDVYITNHEPTTKKFSTTCPQDDEEFFRYKKSLEAYNQEGEVRRSKNILRGFFNYKRGSFLQRAFDPFAGAEKKDDGSLFL
mmetsp:Transcript_40496/g.38993  ORF Transcript_40496/g.38993 Transcript_40496/m.38993 type:complete len:193 (+) Transcript_40496:729-1307(+)